MTSFSKLWWAEQKNWRPPNLPVIKKIKIGRFRWFSSIFGKKNPPILLTLVAATASLTAHSSRRTTKTRIRCSLTRSLLPSRRATPQERRGGGECG
jgi:hypothetical protein